MSIDGAIGTHDGKPAVAKRYVGYRGLQRSAAACLPFCNDGVCGFHDRLAFRLKPAGAAGAPADGDGVGVPLAHPDLLAADPEPVGGQLHVGGLVTLAGGLGADINIDEPILSETNFRPFRRIAAGRFQIVRQTETAPFASRGGGGATGMRTRRNPSSATRYP